MHVLAGLASLVCLSVFLAWWLRRSSALMPLVAVSLSILFFMVAGCFGLLQEAGFVWYGLCLAAFVVVIVRTKGRFFSLCTPGLLFFTLGGVLVVLLFALTNPMLSHWDEFTFWGTAAKVTAETDLLYTVAPSNLIARSYPPGLMVLNYMMQFWGNYSEGGLLAAYGILYLACFAAAGAACAKSRTLSVLFLGAMVMLPIFFEGRMQAGQILWTYRLVMADLPMALLFGGALCFYYANNEKTTGVLVPFGLILAALTSVKDMGLALAMVALAVVTLDLLFCERDRLRMFCVHKQGGALLAAVFGLAMIAGAYLLWWWHMGTAAIGNRFDVGTQQESLSVFEMIPTGIAMLFGVNRSENFSEVLRQMCSALFTRPVSLLGPGVVVLGLIIVVLVLATLLSATRRQRRRVWVFGLAMLLGFVAFYVFNIFTYTFVFRPAEGLVLREYERYISPYWMAWLMASLVLLVRTAQNEKATFYRLRIARAANAVVCVVLVLGVLLLANWDGFLQVSPSFTTVREDVQRTLAQAEREGMQAGDIVYPVIQEDDGERYYYFGYERPDVDFTLLYYGVMRRSNNELLLDENGQIQMVGNVASTFVDFECEELGPHGMNAGRKEWTAWLKANGCTHVLLDEVNEYFVEEFAPMFEDGLEGWTGGPVESGHRYYRVQWQGDTCTLVPQGGTA